MIEMAEREMTTEEREHILEVALVLSLKQRVSEGADLYELLEQLPITVDEGLIQEMDRQGIW